jgi:hypothetical protein
MVRSPVVLRAFSFFAYLLCFIAAARLMTPEMVTGERADRPSVQRRYAVTRQINQTNVCDHAHRVAWIELTYEVILTPADLYILVPYTAPVVRNRRVRPCC